MTDFDSMNNTLSIDSSSGNDTLAMDAGYNVTYDAFELAVASGEHPCNAYIKLIDQTNKSGTISRKICIHSRYQSNISY